MSETFNEKFDQKELTVGNMNDDIFTQAATSESYLASKCEHRSKIRYDIDESTGARSTACAESSTLRYDDSTHQLINLFTLREAVKQELPQETSSDLSNQSSIEIYDSKIDGEGLYT